MNRMFTRIAQTGEGGDAMKKNLVICFVVLAVLTVIGVFCYTYLCC